MATYFDVDPALVRILAVIGLFASFGTAILAYLVAWIIVPRRYEVPGAQNQDNSGSDEVPQENPKWHSLLPGIILVALGVILLIREYVYWFGFGELWPVLLIGLGVALIFYGLSRRTRTEHMESHSTSHERTANGSNGGNA